MHKLADRGLLVHTAHDEHGQITIFDRDGIRSLYFESGACQSSPRLDDPTKLVLGLTKNQTRQTLEQLCSIAQQLTSRLEIDFGKYLDSLQRSNSTELRRGSTAQMASDQSDRASLKS